MPTRHPLKGLFTAMLVFLAARASASTSVKTARNDRDVKINAEGTVVPEGIFQIKATIEGRVESVLVSTNVWRDADQPLAFLANRELAAMLDAKGSQNASVLEERWQRVYRQTPARCPDVCFVLKNFLKAKTWVKPESVMFEAAKTLKLVGRVRPEDASRVRDGQELVFWPRSDPERLLKGRVTRFLFDTQEEQAASFALILQPDQYLDPGTEWEGRIIPFMKKNARYAPSGVLIPENGARRLPTRVSTGDEEWWEVLALDDAQPRGGRRREDESNPANTSEPAAADDLIDYGEDLYAEPQ